MLTLDDMKRIWNKLYRDTYRPGLGGPCDKTLEGRHNFCGPCDKTLEAPIGRTSTDYPEIPDGKPGAYSVAIVDGKIEIIDRSKK